MAAVALAAACPTNPGSLVTVTPWVMVWAAAEKTEAPAASELMMVKTPELSCSIPACETTWAVALPL